MIFIAHKSLEIGVEKPCKLVLSNFVVFLRVYAFNWPYCQLDRVLIVVTTTWQSVTFAMVAKSALLLVATILSPKACTVYHLAETYPGWKGENCQCYCHLVYH